MPVVAVLDATSGRAAEPNRRCRAADGSIVGSRRRRLQIPLRGASPTRREGSGRPDRPRSRCGASAEGGGAARATSAPDRSWPCGAPRPARPYRERRRGAGSGAGGSAPPRRGVAGRAGLRAVRPDRARARFASSRPCGARCAGTRLVRRRSATAARAIRRAGLALTSATQTWSGCSARV